MDTYDQISQKISRISSERDLWDFFRSQAEDLQAILQQLKEVREDESAYASLCATVNHTLVRYVLDANERIGMNSVTTQGPSMLDMKIQAVSTNQNTGSMRQAARLLIYSYDKLFALSENDAGTPDVLAVQANESVRELLLSCKEHEENA